MSMKNIIFIAIIILYIIQIIFFINNNNSYKKIDLFIDISHFTVKHNLTL